MKIITDTIMVTLLWFYFLLSCSQVRSQRSEECIICNDLCLPEEAPFGYLDQESGGCDSLQSIWPLTMSALNQTTNIADREKYLLLRLDRLVDDAKANKNLITGVFFELGLRSNTEIGEYLDEICAMGLARLYQKYFSRKREGVNYHQFMNFAARAHVPEYFLQDLLSDSLKSGKINLMASPHLLDHFMIKMAALNRPELIIYIVYKFGIDPPADLLERMANFNFGKEYRLVFATTAKLKDIGVDMNLITAEGVNIATVFRSKGDEQTAKYIELARGWNNNFIINNRLE